MKEYLKRSNNIPTCVLGWKTPLENRVELLFLLKNTINGLINCLDFNKTLTIHHYFYN